MKRGWGCMSFGTFFKQLGFDGWSNIFCFEGFSSVGLLGGLLACFCDCVDARSL